MIALSMRLETAMRTMWMRLLCALGLLVAATWASAQGYSSPNNGPFRTISDGVDAKLTVAVTAG